MSDLARVYCVQSVCMCIVRLCVVLTDDHHPPPTFTPPELPKKVHLKGTVSYLVILFVYYSSLELCLIHLIFHVGGFGFPIKVDSHDIVNNIIITTKYCYLYYYIRG